MAVRRLATTKVYQYEGRSIEQCDVECAVDTERAVAVGSTVGVDAT